MPRNGFSNFVEKVAAADSDAQKERPLVLNDKYGKEMLHNVIPHWQQVAVGRVHTFIHPPRKTHGVKKLRSFWNCEIFVGATCGSFLKWWVSPTTIEFSY